MHEKQNEEALVRKDFEKKKEKTMGAYRGSY